MMDFLQKFDQNPWREKRLWQPETEVIVDDYKPILNELYQKYSGRKNLFGHEP